MTLPSPANHSLSLADQALFVQVHAAQRKALQARKRRESRKTKRPRVATSAQAPSCGRARTARQCIGDRYEARAQALLERAGLRILARQVSCPAGEIDLVASEQNILVFVEVRARSALSHGGAAASITRSKQARMIRAIKWWLPRLAQEHFDGTIPCCRIDVVTFDPFGAQWISDAIRLDQGR